MRELLDFVAGLLLRRIVGPPAAEREASARARRRPGRRGRRPGVRGGARRRAASPQPAPSQKPLARGRPRGTLVGLMLGSFAVGAPLMLLFEAWYTRLVGVLALFTFVVAGVFVIAGAGMLDPEQDEERFDGLSG